MRVNANPQKNCSFNFVVFEECFPRCLGI